MSNSTSSVAAPEQTKSASALLRMIVSIGKASKALEKRIHEAGIGCLQHAEIYGDCTPMQKLYQALPKSQRREALLDWVHANSPIRIRQEGEKVGMLKADDKSFTPFNLEAANAVPYWEKDERAMKPMGSIDPEKLIQQAIDRLQKRMDDEAEAKKTGEESNVVYFKEGVDPSEEMANLKAALAAIQAAKPVKRQAA